jgi:hypothetical protein
MSNLGLLKMEAKRFAEMEIEPDSGGNNSDSNYICFMGWDPRQPNHHLAPYHKKYPGTSIQIFANTHAENLVI